jgi:ADP-ribose pyrophosphatase YjhB (NUDIX family)
MSSKESKEKTRIFEVAVAIVRDSNNKYLLVSSAKDYGNHHGEWYPPGGHLEQDESVLLCLRRELKEELNLNVKPIEKIATTAGDIPGQITYWWNCKIIDGEIKKDNSISDYGFFSEEEVRELPLWPATKKFFEKYIWK